MIARPLLFSAPMVRALLTGKSQTRRVAKLPHMNPLGQWEPSIIGGRGVYDRHGQPSPEDACLWHTRTGDVLVCSHGRAGDVLWVRETHYVWSAGNRDGSGRRIDYRATEPEAPCTWTPSIHMPRWASRLTLRITNVRVERLQDISEADAIAEGITMPESEREDRDESLCAQCGGTLLVNRVHPGGGMMFDCDCHDCDTAQKRYRHLWNYINGRDAWAANPWCWALTFSVEKRNVDDVLREVA